MKFKLDENIGERGRALFASAGHDVATVREQRMSGAADDRLFEVCKGEGRVLVTLDHDFAQTLRYPLAGSPGIAVLELPPRPGPESIRDRIREMLAAIDTQGALTGQLWIVEPGRIRIRSAED